MRSSRGQSAVEYLVTHGWAILLLAIVIAVLYGLGIFNPARYAAEDCSFQPGFGCGSYELTRGNLIAGSYAYKLNPQLENGLGYDIAITKIEITTDGLGKGGVSTCTITSSGTSPSGTCRISPSGTTTVTLPYFIPNGARTADLPRPLALDLAGPSAQEAFPAVGNVEPIRLKITYRNCNTLPNYVPYAQGGAVSQNQCLADAALPAPVSSQHILSGSISARVQYGG